MRKLFFWLGTVLLSFSAFSQAERVGKDVFPENQTFGFSMTADKKTSFFVRSWSGRDTMIIYSSVHEKGKWQKPKPVSFTARPGEWKDIDPFVTPDGKKLFFQSNRGLKKGDPVRKNFDIWVTERTLKGWSEPKNIGPMVNSDSSESFLSSTANGKLFFGSSRAGGFGKIDIYSSAVKDGTYEQPINVGMTINTTDHDTNPFIAHDESFLIFSKRSDRPANNSDLYITFNNGGQWTKPWNLGPTINTEISEFCPFVLPDEDTIYFARLDKTGKVFIENLYKSYLPISKMKKMAGYKAEIFAEGVISTGDVLSTTFEPDGKTVYFVKSLPDRTVAKIFKSVLQSDGKWSTPELLPLSMINPFTATPYVTRDDGRMIFSANIKNMDLWVSEKFKGRWQEPYPFPGNINSSFDDYFPSMADNGTLYFASSRGLGGGDIFRSRLLDGVYQEAESLTDLNTPQAESNPLIAPDESFLIFMALRPEGFGDYDLYISYNENGKWSSPINLGPSINSDVKDFQPALSPDGKYFYFSRTPWPSGSGKRYGPENIYRIDIDALPLKQ